MPQLIYFDGILETLSMVTRHCAPQMGTFGIVVLDLNFCAKLKSKFLVIFLS